MGKSSPTSTQRFAQRPQPSKSPRSTPATRCETTISARPTSSTSSDFQGWSFNTTFLYKRNDAWLLVGDLTIKDVTRPIELELDFLGVDPTGLQGEIRRGLSGRGDLLRREFGITFGLAGDSKLVVGDKIDLTLDIQAFLDG